MSEVKFKRIDHGYYKAYEATTEYTTGRGQYHHTVFLRITHDDNGWNLRVKRNNDEQYRLHRFVTEYDTKRDVVSRVNEMLAANEAWNL